jgi:hypothetical protein
MAVISFIEQTPEVNVIKLFTILIYELLSRVFVPGTPVQLSLLFVCKARSLSYIGAIETCLPRVGSVAFSANILLVWTGFPGTNTLA